MNIVVAMYSGGICCRPDTTLERECRDMYAPDFVEGWLYSPVLFARISKAGKCVGDKFAGRYYDCAGYGMLLYPSAFKDSGGNVVQPDTAWTSCLDHTSVIPQAAGDPAGLEGRVFRLACDGEEVFSTTAAQSCETAVRAAVEKALCMASQYVSLRIGDILAVELAAPAGLNGKSPKICATLGDSEIFRFSFL